MEDKDELVLDQRSAGDLELIRSSSPMIVSFAVHRWDWEPQPDITVHELAACLGIVLNGASVSSLPESAQRHFKRVAV